MIIILEILEILFFSFLAMTLVATFSLIVRGLRFLLFNRFVDQSLSRSL